jgi:hypothetical protein
MTWIEEDREACQMDKKVFTFPYFYLLSHSFERWEGVLVALVLVFYDSDRNRRLISSSVAFLDFDFDSLTALYL